MTAETGVRVERRIDAPPEDVYAYLTDSVRWARWQGESAEIEAVPGGLFRMTMANGGIAEGQFVELVPAVRVVFTWGWRGSEVIPPGSSTVEIDLTPEGGGTLLRLTHRDLPAEQEPVHLAGWNHYLPRLAAVAGGLDPGPDALPG